METQPIAPNNKMLVAPTHTAYGFSNLSTAITGVINLFFFFYIIPVVVLFAIHLVIRSKKNLLQNVGVSLLGGIISGILTVSVLFISIFLSLAEYPLQVFIFCAYLVFVLIFPAIVTRVISSRYANGTDKFLYGSGVYLMHVITLFILYRIAISFLTAQSIFGPNYF